MQQPDDAREYGGCTRVEATHLIDQVQDLRSQLQRARDREHLLCEITRHVVTGPSVSVMLSNVLAVAIAYAGADAGSIVLLDDRDQTVRQVDRLAQPPNGGPIAQLPPQATFNSGLL